MLLFLKKVRVLMESVLMVIYAPQIRIFVSFQVGQLNWLSKIKFCEVYYITLKYTSSREVL